MVCKSYKASTPGSLMLFGEHAVLHNKTAIVAAINHYIHIDLTLRYDRKIQIISSAFGEHTVELDKFKITKPYNYVLTAIKQYLTKINCGFVLNVKSEFSADIGFGSSAAVTVATLGVLALWLEKKSPDLMQLYRQAVEVVRLVHGVGSGADVAASVFGGVIAYQMDPVKIQRLKSDLPLIAVYSGSKTPTFKVVAQVEKRQEQLPVAYSDLYDAIGDCVDKAVVHIKENDLSGLGELMNVHQLLQEELGTSNAILNELVFALRSEPNIYGAKISGAGMGDCVIGLGKIAKNTFPKTAMQKKLGVKQISVKINDVGFVHLK